MARISDHGSLLVASMLRLADADMFDGFTPHRRIERRRIGAEDYIELAKICKFVVIDNLPNFSDQNINQQQRFITLIDILYEHKVKLMISCNVHIDKLESSNNLKNVFKRTLSRIYQLTSPRN